jgi:hypothetical protein
MKIQPEHYERMRAAIEIVLDSHPTVAAEYQAAGHSLKRLRWDVARAAGLVPYMCATLYSYANDEHIDTALRRIFGHKE